MPFVNGIWYNNDVNDGEDLETPPETGPSEPESPTAPEEPKPITKSILLTIKKMLGIAEEYHAYDIDILIHINSVFLTLNQLGVGPTIPFQITGSEEVWSDFYGDQEQYLVGVQTYVYLKVRLLFDPPTNSFVVDSYHKQCEEFEWRFTVQPKNQESVDYVESFKVVHEPPSEEIQNGGDKSKEDNAVVPLTIKDRRNESIYDIFS